MKRFLLLTCAAAAMIITSCTTEDDALSLGTENQESGAQFYAPSFPEDDGSIDLKSTSRKTNFNKLIKATDPQRALDRSVVDITDAHYAEIKEKADELCAGLTTNVKKLDALNTWVHKHVTYTYADNDAYQVFKSGKGICQGYANLLKVMALSQDIPCVIVNGWYGYEGHAWNYAYADNGWYVCDPTAGGRWNITLTSGYQSYEPEMCDIVLFDDENFEYNYYEGYLNVCRVKNAGTDLVVPYSTNGYRVAMFNPTSAIPASVRNIYIGKNIKSLGQNIVGLADKSASDEMCFVDEANKQLGSHNGVVYNKDNKGNLTTLLYIPSMMTRIVLMPMEVVDKNTIINQKNVEEIVFTEGTKRLEPYAIEECPKLKTVYVPEDCTVDKQAIYNCPKSVQVIKGLPTGIHQVRL